MPSLVELAVVRAHVAQADLAEADGTAHQVFDDGQDARMANQLIEARGGDEGIVVGVLVMAVGVPEVAVVFAIGVEHVAKIVQLLTSQHLTQVQYGGFLDLFAPLLIHCSPSFLRYLLATHLRMCWATATSVPD